jgi:hypothetical protein
MSKGAAAMWSPFLRSAFCVQRFETFGIGNGEIEQNNME